VTDEIQPEHKPSEDSLPAEGTLADGMRIIADFVRTLPKKPGVYRMIAADGEVLYVGKARSLRNRVAAYTQPTRLETRLMRMVSMSSTAEVIRKSAYENRGPVTSSLPAEAIIASPS